MPGTTTDAGCSEYRSDADVSIPVSFAADVMPIFAQNCAVGGGTCHGDVASLPYLGLADGSAGPASILGKLVGVKAGEDPAMDFVAPNDAGRSYLMHKMDGDQCMFAKECATTPLTGDLGCGAPMPFLSPRLPAPMRDTIRAWIGQGAQNN